MKNRWLGIAAGICLAVTGALSSQGEEYRILGIRVDFPYEEPDHETTSGRGVFDLGEYASDTEIRNRYFHPWDIPPHDRAYFEHHLTALGNYWHAVSDGRIGISSEVWPRESDDAYTMSRTFYKYGNGRTERETYEKLADLVREAAEACKAAEGDAVDFSAYDTIVVIHAGIGSETSGILNDIPSAYLSENDFTTYLGGKVAIDGRTIEHALVVPEMTSANGNSGLNGILAQMFGFRLGLPSLSNNEDGLPAAGGWALMDVGAMAWGAGTLGFIPTQPCAWSKIELGLVEPVVVNTDTTLDIAATHVSNGLPRAIKVPVTADEYLLIENRYSPTSRDEIPPGVVFSGGDSAGVWLSAGHYDAFIPGSGILVWHIDESIIAAGRADHTLNNDTSRRGIDLLEADGRQDIGALFGFGDPRAEYSTGHADDTYKAGGTAVISPSTDPNTGSLWGGSSGITVTVNSEPGEIMNVSISFAGRLPGFPVAIPGAKQVTAADLDGDRADEIIVSDADSVTVIRLDGRIDWLAPRESGILHPGAWRHDELGRNALFLTDLRTDGFFYHADDGYSFYYRRETVPPLTARITGPSTVTAFYEPGFIQGSTYCVTAREWDQVAGQPAGSGIFAWNTTMQDVDTSSSPHNPGIQLGAMALIPGPVPIRSFAVAGDAVTVLGGDGRLYTGRFQYDLEPVADLGENIAYGPVLLDIDRDEVYEIALTAGRELRIYEPDGTFDTYVLPANPAGDPAAADLDGDGYPEAVVCVGRQVFAIRQGAVLQAGFPYTLPPGNDGEIIVTSPLIADLDYDGHLDIAFATSAQRMIAFGTDGFLTDGFPLALAGTVTTSPCLFHIDNTGLLGLAYITADDRVIAHNLGVRAADDFMPWPMWRGSAALTNVLENADITAPIRTTAPFEAFCYPNPVTGGIATFRIIPAAATDVTVTLYTLDGRKVFEAHRPESAIIPGVTNDIPVDASSLASGLYLARIETRQRTITYKVGVLR